MPPGHHTTLPPASFLAVFPVMWVGITSFLSVLGGWTRLARRYRTDQRADVPLQLTSGRVGAVNYNNCLRVGFSGEGIHLRILFPFRVLHPPLFIPWSAVSHHTHKTVLKFWSRDVVEIDADSPVKLTLSLTIPPQFLPLLDQPGGAGPSVKVLR